MPIYEYRCSVCHHEIELLHGVHETQKPACPEGCGLTLQRLVSAPRVRFSGQGYYETDEKPKDKQRHILRKEESTESKGSESQKTKENAKPTPAAASGKKSEEV